VTTPSRTKRSRAFSRNSIPLPARKANAAAEGGGKKRHSYKPLATQFRRGGFDYRQIYREGDFAMYRQTWKGNEHSAGFEVIRIRRRDGFQIGDKFVEPYEIYPNSEAWGVDGFTFTNRNKAWAKFFEISLGEPARRGKEVNLKWENPSGNSSAMLST
jgi:hypothetical protein